MLHIFRTPFPKNNSRRLFLEGLFKKIYQKGCSWNCGSYLAKESVAEIYPWCNYYARVRGKENLGLLIPNTSRISQQGKSPIGLSAFSKVLFDWFVGHFGFVTIQFMMPLYDLLKAFPLFTYACYQHRPVEMKKILGGWEFIKKMLTNLLSWLGGWFNWSRLKCPEILNRVEVGNANFRHK